ncbi:MAG: hypothetical protein LBB85_02740 [Dysgonamonadaceae bacterium]|jgi:hypothetical protein|nr:hypothetical protein [Dysgonamonadaceae bacterium]
MKKNIFLTAILAAITIGGTMAQNNTKPTTKRFTPTARSEKATRIFENIFIGTMKKVVRAREIEYYE